MAAGTLVWGGGLVYSIRKMFRPEIFQGKYRTRHYFEGWYFKLISKNREDAIALIPGISLGENPQDHHAFIQQIEGFTGQVDYFRFAMKEFSFSEQCFAIRIADNQFSDTEIKVNIKQQGRRIGGQVQFTGIRKLRRTLLWPGIMGPFGFVPGMECYHGIVNLHHALTGSLMTDDRRVDFTGGYGYVEKDWGRSFPRAWIWLQCNHFDATGVSLMFSLAKIPFLKRHFMGFISFLCVGESEYRFATYTRAKLTELGYADNILRLTVEDQRLRMTIEAEHGKMGLLKAPKNGRMTAQIHESISATVFVTLSTQQGQLIFSGAGTNAGMELVEGILESYQTAST